MAESDLRAAARSAVQAVFHDPSDGVWPGHYTAVDKCQGCRRAADAAMAAVELAVRAQVAAEIAAAIGVAKPDLTCTEVDTRVHGIRSGQYLDVNTAWRIAQDHAAPRSEAGNV